MGKFWENIKGMFARDMFSKVENTGDKFLQAIEEDSKLSLSEKKKKQIEEERKIFGTWMLPDGPARPILEKPATRMQQYKFYNYFFENDDLAGPAITSLSEFIFSSGYDVSCIYNSPEKISWVPQDMIDSLSEIDAYKESAPQKAVSEYVTSETLKILKENILLDANLDLYMLDEFLYGNVYLYLIYNWDTVTMKQIENTTDILEKKRLIKEATTRLGNFEVVEVQQINPGAVNVVRDTFGNVEKYIVVDESIKHHADVDPYNMIHIKLGVPDYITYGKSKMQNALRALMVKEGLDVAQKAFSDRYALPVKMLKVGMTLKDGSGDMPYISSTLLEQAATMLKYYDPTKGKNLVVPYFYDFEMIGAEGKMPKLERMIEQLNSRVLIALGIPETLITGEYKSFAAAKVILSTLTEKLNPLRIRVKQALENKITKRLALMRGWYDNSNNLVYGKINFAPIDIGSEDSLRSLLLGLLQLKGQGVDVISMKTARERLDFVPEIEQVNIDEENKKIEAKQKKDEARRIKQQDVLRQPNKDEELRLPNDHKLSPREKHSEETKRNKDWTLKHQNNATNYLEKLIADENYLDIILDDPNKISKLGMDISELRDYVEELSEIVENLEDKNEK